MRGLKRSAETSKTFNTGKSNQNRSSKLLIRAFLGHSSSGRPKNKKESNEKERSRSQTTRKPRHIYRT